MIIGDILKRNAKLYPQKSAIIYEDHKIDYETLNRRVNRLGHALLGQSLNIGDRVAVLMRNRPEYLECYFGGAKTGVVIVPINYRLSEKEISYILSDATPRGIIFEEAYNEIIGDLMNFHSHLQFAVCVGKDNIKWAFNYEEWIQSAAESGHIANVTPEDLIYIMYTSGTTGKPKGAMITHKNSMANTYTHCLETKLKTTDTFMTAAPLCLTGGINKTIGSMLMGVTAYIEPRFELPRFIERLTEFQISHVFLVPAMIIFLLESPGIGNYNFSNLNMIMYGSAPIPIERLKDALKTFDCDFIQTFGQTESSPVLTVLRPEDHLIEGLGSKRLLSAGREAIGVEVRIFDDNDLEVSTGKVGEIVARGDNIMKGYWNLPEETKKTLKDGWLHTGDLGWADENKYIFVVDRKKDMIISGGMNIYSKEIEDLISSHPAVIEATVIGIPDEKWGEAIKAFVVLQKNEKVTELEIISYCQDRLASYKKPKSVTFLENLPKNTAGKIMKKKLRKAYWNGKERMVS